MNTAIIKKAIEWFSSNKSTLERRATSGIEVSFPNPNDSSLSFGIETKLFILSVMIYDEGHADFYCHDKAQDKLKVENKFFQNENDLTDALNNFFIPQ
jgi:hypothetical protein